VSTPSRAEPQGFPAGLGFAVVGGSGAVGGLFARRLAESGARVTVVDLAPPGDPGPGSGPGAAEGRAGFLRGDLTDLSDEVRAEFARADAVLLAVPEQIALDSVKQVCALLGPGTLLVDTLSVKGPLVAAVRAVAPDREMVSLNPMFAPSLGFEGRPVAAVVVHDGDRARQLLDLVGSWGGRVVQVSEHTHDRLAAATQALPHAAVLALGLALPELGIDIVELASIAPPPFTTMLALLARIASGSPEVYWDIQWANPQAPQARAALADGLQTLAELVRSGDESGFADAQQRLRGYFGAELDHFTALCARLFTVPASTDQAPSGGTIHV
jgi:4-amino-4-deoxyprephenate dehydrogenase